MHKTCDIKKCEELLGPGSAKIGYLIDGEKKPRELNACPYHTALISMAPRGTWKILEDKTLKALPARPMFFT